MGNSRAQAIEKNSANAPDPGSERMPLKKNLAAKEIPALSKRLYVQHIKNATHFGSRNPGAHRPPCSTDLSHRRRGVNIPIHEDHSRAGTA
jgi:hypothetical protein